MDIQKIYSQIWWFQDCIGLGGSGSTSEAQNAEVFAMSSYRRDQQSQRASTSTASNTPKPDYTCYRCHKTGQHYQNECPDKNSKCFKCDRIGHLQSTCKRQPSSSNSRDAPRSGSGHANAIRAYVERLSPNDLAVFNAQQIEKAENNGLVYNVETNDVENPENMTRHQRAGMFGHLN